MSEEQRKINKHIYYAYIPYIIIIVEINIAFQNVHVFFLYKNIVQIIAVTCTFSSSIK